MIRSRIAYVVARANTAAALLRFLRPGPVRLEAAKAIREAIAARNDRFLTLLDAAVFANPESPYLALIRHAGLTPREIRRTVAERGLEGALAALARAGVFASHDEMKGRAPAVRGGAVFRFDERDFDNPLIRLHARGRTSGYSGRPTVTRINFAHYESQLPLTALECEGLSQDDAAIGLWLPPLAAGLSFALRTARLGLPPDKWFSQIALDFGQTPDGPRRDAFGLIALARLFGARLPWPEHAPISDPEPVARWIASRLEKGKAVLFSTHPASAVRLCLWARRHGLPLQGATFLVAGEPVTGAKRRAIESSGAACRPYYAASELGVASTACLSPSSPDDVHLCLDRFAVIGGADPPGDRRPGERLLVTGLSLAGPKILINAETGDRGVLEQRDCGCRWHALGYQTHLREIWSPAKMTAEGLTFENADILAVLEEALPERFGGAPGDFQLAVEAGEGGQALYRLLVSPDLGALDEPAVRQGFLDALARGPEVHRLMAEMLDRAGQFEVARRVPVWTPGGKWPPVLGRPDADPGSKD